MVRINSHIVTGSICAVEKEGVRCVASVIWLIQCSAAKHHHPIVRLAACPRELLDDARLSLLPPLLVLVGRSNVPCMMDLRS